jgi:hypothetical protein
MPHVRPQRRQKDRLYREASVLDRSSLEANREKPFSSFFLYFWGTLKEVLEAPRNSRECLQVERCLVTTIFILR